jgi:hypothetical protein
MIGRLSAAWTDAQDQWLVQISTRWKLSSARWAKNTVQGIWEILWDMWLHRNSVLHHPQHPWKIAAITTTDKAIKEIWRTYVPTCLRTSLPGITTSSLALQTSSSRTTPLNGRTSGSSQQGMPGCASHCYAPLHLGLNESSCISGSTSRWRLRHN